MTKASFLFFCFLYGNQLNGLDVVGLYHHSRICNLLCYRFLSLSTWWTVLLYFSGLWAGCLELQCFLKLFHFLHAWNSWPKAGHLIFLATSAPPQLLQLISCAPDFFSLGFCFILSSLSWKFRHDCMGIFGRLLRRSNDFIGLFSHFMNLTDRNSLY